MTYDPSRPDPVQQVRPRRERVVRVLLVLLLAFAVLPFVVSLPHWLLVVVATTTVGMVLTIFGIMLIPLLIAHSREDHEERP